MKWAKKLKTKNEQNMLSGPFSHDAAQLIFLVHEKSCVNAIQHRFIVKTIIYYYLSGIFKD